MKDITQQGVSAFLEFIDSNDRSLIPYLFHEFSDFMPDTPVKAYRGVRYPNRLLGRCSLITPTSVTTASLSMSRAQASSFADDSIAIGRRKVKFSNEFGLLYQAEIQGEYLNLHKLASYLVSLDATKQRPEGVFYDVMDTRLQLALTEQELIGTATLVTIAQYRSNTEYCLH